MGITPNRYIELWFESGHMYLDRYQAETLAMVPQRRHRKLRLIMRMFRVNPRFWLWWRFETEAIDRAFLARQQKTGRACIHEYTYMQTNRVATPPQEIIDEVLHSATSEKLQAASKKTLSK